MWMAAAQQLAGSVLPVRGDVVSEAPVAGSKWWCRACQVSQRSPHKPICWVCRSADQVVSEAKFRNPCSAWRNPLLEMISDD